VQHLIIDLPSVNREQDEGKLSAHHIFWQYLTATRTAATISEMAFINDLIIDVYYFVNLQVMPIQLDAVVAILCYMN
jgi:arylformamidase